MRSTFNRGKYSHIEDNVGLSGKGSRRVKIRLGVNMGYHPFSDGMMLCVDRREDIWYADCFSELYLRELA